MSWNIKTPGDYINGPLTVAGNATFNSNISLGGIQSAWSDDTLIWKAIDIIGSSFAATGAGSGEIMVGHNAFYDDVDKRWEFKYTGDRATRYAQTGSGVHTWYNTSGTGTANNPITWIPNLHLDASGRLVRGGTTADALTTDLATMVNIGNFAVQNAANTGTLIAIKPDVANQNVNINVDARSGGLPDLRFLFGSAEKFRMTATGNLNFQSGQGVNFGATTEAAGMTSETLNDYEEGTFAPVITSGMTAITYSDQNGRYVKIGRLVSFYIRLLTSAGTRDGGQLIFGGLPFNVGTGNGVAMIEYNNSGFQSGSSDATPRFYLPGGFGVIELYNSNGSAFLGNQLGSGGFDLRIFGHYFVA